MRENVSGVELMTVVGLALPKFGLSAAACRPLTAAVVVTPQSADAGRSFNARGASIAVQTPVLADAGVTAAAVVVTIAKTDKPMAAVEKPLRITIPPPGRYHWRVRPRATGASARNRVRKFDGSQANGVIRTPEFEAITR